MYHSINRQLLTGYLVAILGFTVTFYFFWDALRYGTLQKTTLSQLLAQEDSTIYVSFDAVIPDIAIDSVDKDLIAGDIPLRYFPIVEKGWFSSSDKSKKAGALLEVRSGQFDRFKEASLVSPRPEQEKIVNVTGTATRVDQDDFESIQAGFGKKNVVITPGGFLVRYHFSPGYTIAQFFLFLSLGLAIVLIIIAAIMRRLCDNKSKETLSVLQRIQGTG